MKFISLLAVGLAALAEANSISTRTVCQTEFASTKGPVSKTTKTRNSIVNKTRTRYTVQTTTVTPATTTIVVKKTKHTTITTDADAGTDTVTIIDTATQIDSFTSTALISETTTLVAPTTTITSTSTVQAPAGFTPINGNPSRRDVDTREAFPAPARPQSPPKALGCPSETKFPHKISCEVDIIKTSVAFTTVPAKKTRTITASTPSKTVTSWTTLSTTTTIIPIDVEFSTTVTSTTKISTTLTTSITTTFTSTPALVTEQPTATYYAACASNNMVSYEAESGYLGSAQAQTDSPSNSAYDCCALCFQTDDCAVSLFYSAGSFCRMLSTPGQCPIGTAGFYAENPVTQNAETFMNGPCGTWAPLDG